MEDKHIKRKKEREDKDIILNKIACVKKDTPNKESAKQDEKQTEKDAVLETNEDYYAMLLCQANSLESHEDDLTRKNAACTQSDKSTILQSTLQKKPLSQGMYADINRDMLSDIPQHPYKPVYQQGKADSNHTPINNNSAKMFFNNQIQNSQTNLNTQQSNTAHTNTKTFYKMPNNMSSIEMNCKVVNNKDRYEAKTDKQTSKPYNRQETAYSDADYNNAYLDNPTFNNYLLTENVTYYPNPYDYQAFTKEKQSKTNPFSFKKKYATLLRERNFYEPLVFVSDDKDLESKYLRKEEMTTKPPYSYSQLITKALESNSENIMTLSEIYAWIKTNFDYYKKSDTTWQNSIRHNLSLNKMFKKVPRPSNKPGKGGFWSIDYDYIANDESRKIKRRSKEDYMRKELAHDYYYKEDMYYDRDYYYNDYTSYSNGHMSDNYDQLLYDRYTSSATNKQESEDSSDADNNQKRN